MQEIKSYEDLNEKSLEIILNFRAQDNYDKTAVNEILKLKGDIKKAIIFLPKEQQEVFELRYFKNYTSEQVAQVLGKQKEEIIKTLLRGINGIKEVVKSGELKPNITNELLKVVRGGVKLEKKEEKKELTTPEVTKGQGSMLGGFLTMGFFILIVTIVFYFVPKFFNPVEMLGQLASGSNSSVQEKMFNRNIVKNINKKDGVRTVKSDPRNIKVSGSTSLSALARRLENAFNIEYPKYHLSLILSDSDKGINDLIEGKTDIANSSKPIGFNDQNKAQEHGVELVEHRIALDALVVILNKKNPIEELSLDDLQGIFGGEIKTWDTLSDFTEALLPIAREKGSGTNDFVINRILEGSDFPSDLIRQNSNQEIIKTISENKGAIGFINSTNYPWENPEIKFIKIKNYSSSISVTPFVDKRLNEQAIRYGDYPLAHYLYLISLTNAPKKVEEFVDWVLSTSGQKVVRYTGLIPVVNEG